MNQELGFLGFGDCGTGYNLAVTADCRGLLYERKKMKMDYADFSLIHAQKAAGDPIMGGASAGELTERERHLIGLAVATTKGCPECTAARMKAAANAGISEKAVQEAVNLVAGMNAGFVIQAAVRACGK
jgi:AhpD family alkylhydroperoxidase